MCYMHFELTVKHHPSIWGLNLKARNLTEIEAQATLLVSQFSLSWQ
jgi:hypothetical protein